MGAGLNEAAVQGGFDAAGSIIGSALDVFGGNQTTRESRSRSGTIFNRDFLNEVGRYIGAPLSLGELFDVGSRLVKSSGSLLDSIGGQFDLGSFKPMSVGENGRIKNTGLASLGIIPRTGKGTSGVGNRASRFPNINELVQDKPTGEDTNVQNNDPNRGEGNPDSNAGTGIPEGSTRRYSIAVLNEIWQFNDLDKFPDVERVFRKARESGYDIDMNNFTLGEFQQLVHDIKKIDPKLSARSIGNFELALAHVTNIARGEEGFDQGRGTLGPNRFRPTA